MAEYIAGISVGVIASLVATQLASALLLRTVRPRVRIELKTSKGDESVVIVAPRGAEKLPASEGWLNRLAIASIQYIGNSPRAK